MSKETIDVELQERLRRDDRNALETIYSTYKPAFLNYAKTYSLSEDDALDIYQDAAVALYQNFVTKQLVLSKSSIKTYLFGIGKNKIFKFLKTKNKPLQYSEIKEDTITEINFDDDAPTELQLQLAKNLKQISDSCNQLLRLFYYRGLTIEEIIEQTDYKDSNTIRSHKSRCIKRLKTLFKTVG
ncbi:MAG: RNA polymerase sigma factor [Jejuia sp.]